MKIKIITCHDVYNVGASLQAFALSSYLDTLGHDVKIIDYKPNYLQHYRLTGVNNSVYDRPVLRQIYQVLKFPGRLKARFSSKKKIFDTFTNQFLRKTEKTYLSFEDLKKNPPEADLYIAGSDQVWNPVFQNGKDPAFFLEFAPYLSRKISYAASFAVDSLKEEDIHRIKPWLSQFDAISVREQSGVSLLQAMGLDGVQVCDPVFLLEPDEWENIANYPDESGYLFVYDFDSSSMLQEMAEKIAKERGIKIVSVFPMKGADIILNNMGPREFLGRILNASVVISNSFHATAFSLIFHKEFYVINRQEKINTRMRDLLLEMNISGHLVSSVETLENIQPVDWNTVEDLMKKMIERSRHFLEEQIACVSDT